MKRARRSRARLRATAFGLLARAISCLALSSVLFVAGAAVMYFRLPMSRLLEQSFTRAEAWLAPDSGAEGDAAQFAVTVDVPGKTCDGFTLWTTTQGPEAVLTDMAGRVVHRWMMRHLRPWPRAPLTREPEPGDKLHWEKCYLYPNGDVLALCSARLATPYGYGLAKFDKDSNVIWGYSVNAHHDFTVGDDGRIYLLTDRLVTRPPQAEDWIPENYIADDLVILSSDGKELETIPLLEAFRETPYWLTLARDTEAKISIPPQAAAPMLPPGVPHPAAVAPMPPQPGVPPILPALVPPPPPLAPPDLLHANSVRVLGAAQAPKFPLFKPGQILVSLRSPSVLAVLDTQTRSVVWAAQSAWRHQHSASFLDNGRILLFDNFGSARGSRILEYDPATQAMPWAFGGGKDGSFLAVFRGAAQRLSNGNTLVVDAEGGRLFEVSASREVVWQCSCGGSVPIVTGARRYEPAALPFLNGGPPVRPK